MGDYGFIFDELCSNDGTPNDWMELNLKWKKKRKIIMAFKSAELTVILFYYLLGKKRYF